MPMIHCIARVVTLFYLVLGGLAAADSALAQKTMTLNPATPEPTRFVVRGISLIDLRHPGKPLFFRGIGYSPFLPGESPVTGQQPADDGRYPHHLALIKAMHANYIHVFPRLMPPKFFKALDTTDFLYSQDVWVWSYEDDFLAPAFQEKTLGDIKEVIDHTYKVGRPDRLVLFSIGDELQAKCIVSTDKRHPDVHDYHGRHLSVTGRTPTEVAMAMLVDKAMDYELTRYGRRHLYCHTSWTHVGPLADRPDLDVGPEHVLDPDIGDLICLNVYTYAHGVVSSPPGSVTGTPYQGYLEELAAKYNKPIFVTQVGLATSPIAPRSDIPGFGGHKPPEVAGTLASVWRDIRTAKGAQKFCGISIFELQDEWWKSAKGPAASLHQDANDPEEWFGIYAANTRGQLIPKKPIPGAIARFYGERGQQTPAKK